MRTSRAYIPRLLPLVLGGLLPLVGAGCNEGPAERAGERVDEAARDVRDTVDPPSGPVEAVGRKIDDAAGRAP
jgi:hypothetical protein